MDLFIHNLLIEFPFCFVFQSFIIDCGNKSIDFSKMASSTIDIEKSKISKMSEIDLANSGSGELITGFSTPPSSSLDNCDSGFNDLYSNNFALLSSGNMKSAHTTPAQTGQLDSSPESAQLFDDNSIAGGFSCACLLLFMASQPIQFRIITEKPN